MQTWQEFKVNDQLEKKVAEKLRRGPEIFSFREDPLLAALTACLGLKKEMGVVQMDRLSQPLNVDLSQWSENPWQSQLIQWQNQIGIRMWIEGVAEFYPDHVDFAKVLHPMSIDANGKLSQIVIFPSRVAHEYSLRGLELVVVRDWALSSFLVERDEERVHYFKTNEWEIQSNCARLQTLMMHQNQVAFMGTHDLADHLLGGHGRGIQVYQDLYNQARALYEDVFCVENSPTKRELIVSYLVGVILDDMAQPKWYGSSSHQKTLRKSLNLLRESAGITCLRESYYPPQSFHDLMNVLRNKSRDDKTVDATFQKFRQDMVS